VQWEKLPLDVKAVMDYARRQPGINRVILLGHSGGSPMMSLYQAIAEKGKSVCESKELSHDLRERRLRHAHAGRRDGLSRRASGKSGAGAAAA
jgi:carbonic anhydrase